MRFEKILKGGDLRSIGKTREVVAMVNDQQSFDELYQLLFHPDRKIVMRAADAIEKITVNHPEYLYAHKNQILPLLTSAGNIELKWHLAQLIPRLSLTRPEANKAVRVLFSWASDPKESRIVRANALQSLDEIISNFIDHKKEFLELIATIKKENIPSLNARIKILEAKREASKGDSKD